MKKRIFAVAEALCLMAGTGAAQRPSRPPLPRSVRPWNRWRSVTERMQKELKLTDAQAKEVYNLNFQQIKEMQAMREKMRRRARPRPKKMKSILTTEQFVQWSQMQAPRPGQRGHGPQMMKKGDRRGGGKECCDKPCPKKDKKGKECEVRSLEACYGRGASVWSTDALLPIRPVRGAKQA